MSFQKRYVILSLVDVVRWDLTKSVERSVRTQGLARDEGGGGIGFLSPSLGVTAMPC